jgi:small glutamine-rich tetratricopeptide repeat-containing protein alpha
MFSNARTLLLTCASIMDRKVLVSILEYLQSVKDDAVDGGNVENAIAILEEEFGLSNQAESFKDHSYFPTTLGEIFEAGTGAVKAQTYSDALAEAKSNGKFESFVEVVKSKGYFDGAEEDSVEYLKRNAKLLRKFKEKASKAPVTGPSREEAQAQADELKFKGNAAINSKDYDEAIRCYTEALALVSDGPESHVYHSNRAAAYCYQKKYQEAVDDCEACIGLCPDYLKAHARLGLALFFLERYEESVAAYERALELEPDNKANQDSLKQARNKLKKVTGTGSKASSVTAPSGGMDGLPAGIPPGMMKNPAVRQAMDQMGGPAGLAALMKDPQMMSMAQQMMKDPAMMQQAMSMLGGGGGGGGGGMPDLSALAGMMGGMGGMGGGDPPSSSSAGGKKPFKGFED